MEPTAGFAEHLELTERESKRAHHQEDSVRRQLEHVIAARRFWEDLRDSLRRRHFAQALLVLRRDAALMRHFEASDEAVARALQQLRVELQQHTRSTVVTVAREFPATLRNHGIKIDATSRHPIYTFNQGFLRVELDERTSTAKVVPRDGNEALVGLDLDLVAETIRAEWTRLFDRATNAQSFLRRLHTAYTAILRTEQRPAGDAVPLRRVANRLAKNVNHFAADEFNIDLSRLVQRGETLVDGKRLHLNHTRDRRKGMLLHGIESGGYVGFISFRPEKKGQS